MELLIVVTSNYPYGVGEEFFETEVDYLASYFDYIYIISLSSATNMTRTIPLNTTVTRVDINLSNLDKILSLRFALSKYFFEELKRIKSSYKLNVTKNIIKLIFSTYIKGEKIYKIINSIMKSSDDNLRIFLYSYWMNEGAYAIAKSKINNSKVKSFCRVHGHDLYFERSVSNYLPLRNFVVKNLDFVFPISCHGKNYIENKLELESCRKIIVSRLGIKNDFEITSSDRETYFFLLSCSYLTDIKRINLIIEAISNIDDFYLKWVHIGDGDISEELKLLSKTKLGRKANIKYEFTGHISNKEIYKFYEKNRIDAFINVSEFEGIPVSMMEALSFGVPIIATNVGGVSEIVGDYNGILLSKNPTIENITNAIKQINNLSIEEYQILRSNSFEVWEEKYNAERNYSSFISIVKAG